jgi:Mrp family chromosome partitioning ATPase
MPFAGIEEHLVSLLAPTSFEAEQYRTLAHLLEQRRQGAEPLLVAVSSPAPGDGKTITAINLVGALTVTRHARVLLVEADLRQPRIAEYLRLDRTRTLGLADAARDPSLTLDHVTMWPPSADFGVVSAGQRATTSNEVLTSPALGSLFEAMGRRYEYVILDTPPLIPFLDCRLLERWIDGFLVVVAAHKTPRKLLSEAMNVVDPAKLMGCVFNGDDRPVLGYRAHEAYDRAVHKG